MEYPFLSYFYLVYFTNFLIDAQTTIRCSVRSNRNEDHKIISRKYQVNKNGENWYFPLIKQLNLHRSKEFARAKIIPTDDSSRLFVHQFLNNETHWIKLQLNIGKFQIKVLQWEKDIKKKLESNHADFREQFLLWFSSQFSRHPPLLQPKYLFTFT